MKSVYTLDTISEIAKKLIYFCADRTIITFSGDLGAGKTTLIRALLKEYTIDSCVPSPTFGYVNCYFDAQENRFAHFDLYRLLSNHDFNMMGLSDLLLPPTIKAFIEWPEKAAPLFVKNCVHISIMHSSNGTQRVLQAQLL